MNSASHWFHYTDLLAEILSFGGIDDVTLLIQQKLATNIFPANSLEGPEYGGTFTKRSAFNTHRSVFVRSLFEH
jgi:hypothetical protein